MQRREQRLGVHRHGNHHKTPGKVFFQQVLRKRDLEIIKKQMVWSSTSRFWKNEILVTCYGQNSVCVVKG